LGDPKSLSRSWPGRAQGDGASRRGPFLAVLADRAHGDLLVLLVHVRSVKIRREFDLRHSAMVDRATPLLEHLYSWFIAERPPRDPAAVSATTLAQRGEGRVTNLGAGRARGADPVPGPAKRRQISNSRQCNPLH
jgi:hypothetical protein